MEEHKTTIRVIAAVVLVVWIGFAYYRSRQQQRRSRKR